MNSISFFLTEDFSEESTRLCSALKENILHRACLRNEGYTCSHIGKKKVGFTSHIQRASFNPSTPPLHLSISPVSLLSLEMGGPFSERAPLWCESFARSSLPPLHLLGSFPRCFPLSPLLMKHCWSPLNAPTHYLMLNKGHYYKDRILLLSVFISIHPPSSSMRHYKWQKFWSYYNYFMCLFHLSIAF